VKYFSTLLLATIVALCVAPCVAQAGTLSFIINGKSLHSSNTYEEEYTYISYSTCGSTSSKDSTAAEVKTHESCRKPNRETSTTNKKYNENNSGYGFIYKFDKNHSYIPYLSFGKFRDSFNTDAKYLSGGINKRVWHNKKLNNLHLEVGGVVSLLNSPSYKNGHILVAFTPVLSIGTNNIGVNLAYLPKINATTTHVFFLQLETTLSKFP